MNSSIYRALLFDPVTRRSTAESRAVLGFLTGDDTSSREILKSEGERVLGRRLSKLYARYVDYVAEGKKALSVKRWVTFYLVKMRDLGRIDVRVKDVLSLESVETMINQSYLEYWTYAESLSL